MSAVKSDFLKAAIDRGFVQDCTDLDGLRERTRHAAGWFDGSLADEPDSLG